MLTVQPDFVCADVPVLYVVPTDAEPVDSVRTLVVPSLEEMHAAAAAAHAE
jgi:hypothetical protein